MPRKAAANASPPVRTVKVSGAVAKMDDQRDTARGITLCLVTLAQYSPDSTEVPQFSVRVEDRSLLEGLSKDARIIATGELGRRRGWNTPVLIDSIEPVPDGVEMDLSNDVEIVGERVSAVSKTLDTVTLYNVILKMGDGTTLKVTVFKNLFDKLEGTEDGQMLHIKGALKTFVARGQEVTFVRATDIEVVS